MPEYTFFGRVCPERASLSMETGTATVEGYEIDLDIYANRIIAIVEVESTDEDIYTLRNYAENGSQIALDKLCFTHGLRYRAEIDSVVHPDNTKQTFSVEIGSLNGMLEDGERKEYFDRISKVSGDPTIGPYFNRALRDLGLAMDHPIDSGVFCYRAIESLRQFFVHEHGFDSETESWEALRNELGYTEEELIWFTDYSTQHRHGNPQLVTDSDRAELLSRTWNVIDDMLSFAEEDIL